MKKQPLVLDEKRQERLERRRATRKLRYSSYREIQKGEEKAESFKTSAKRLMGYIWEQKTAFIIVVVTCIISSVFSVLGPDYIGKALDLLNEQVSVKLSGGIISPDALLPCVKALVVIYGGMAVFSFIQQYVMAGVTAKVGSRSTTKAGDTVKIAVDIIHCHLFDKENEITLLARSEEDKAVIESMQAKYEEETASNPDTFEIKEDAAVAPKVKKSKKK